MEDDRELENAVTHGDEEEEEELLTRPTQGGAGKQVPLSTL